MKLDDKYSVKRMIIKAHTVNSPLKNTGGIDELKLKTDRFMQKTEHLKSTLVNLSPAYKMSLWSGFELK